METTEQKREAIKGGEFLIRETKASEVFIPEEWSEEQQMIAQTCKDFLELEIYPKLEDIDSMKDPDLMPALLVRASVRSLRRDSPSVSSTCSIISISPFTLAMVCLR